MTADLSALIARLEDGPFYLTHKEAYDLAIFFGSDTALGMASLIRKAFAGGSLDAALALAERVLGNGPCVLHRNGPSEWGFTYVDDDTAYAATPALSVCAAILRAKQGEGE